MAAALTTHGAAAYFPSATVRCHPSTAAACRWFGASRSGRTLEGYRWTGKV